METQWTTFRAGMKQRREIYEWMKQQFPSSELKPLSAIELLCAQKRYEVLGFCEEDQLKAYAHLARIANGRIFLMDYFGVLPEYQHAGKGSAVLSKLRETLDGDAVLVEAENPDRIDNPEDAETAAARIRFYERNGYRQTSIRVFLFGVDYVILVQPLKGDPDDDSLQEALDGFYRSTIPGIMYKRNVQFRRTEDD